MTTLITAAKETNRIKTDKKKLLKLKKVGDVKVVVTIFVLFFLGGGGVSEYRVLQIFLIN